MDEDKVARFTAVSFGLLTLASLRTGLLIATDAPYKTPNALNRDNVAPWHLPSFNPL
jgi:hypothetical protein